MKPRKIPAGSTQAHGLVTMPLPPKHPRTKKLTTGGGLPCPACGGNTQVIDSRIGEEGMIRRRRSCENHHRFTTLEYAIDNENPELTATGVFRKSLNKLVAKRLRRIAEIIEEGRSDGDVG